MTGDGATCRSTCILGDLSRDDALIAAPALELAETQPASCVGTMLSGCVVVTVGGELGEKCFGDAAE